MAPVISPSGGGSSTGIGNWEPTTMYMFILVLGEIVIAGFLSRHLLKG
jgi:hypothetical protein